MLCRQAAHKSLGLQALEALIIDVTVAPKLRLQAAQLIRLLERGAEEPLDTSSSAIG